MTAAKRINDSKTEVVNIQHEFGLYKGEFGDYILELMRHLEKPIVTTLHTVVANPPSLMKAVVKTIYALSDRVVVPSAHGIYLLENRYGLNSDKAVLMPHGVPSVPARVGTGLAKRRLGLAGKFVIASYGLMNPEKGIEYVLEALPSVIEANPQEKILYMIVGKYHPALSQQARDGYREKLEDLISELSLTRHVKFVEQYLSNREMIRHFLATDVCAVANMNKDQVSSGVLAQAIGCGRSIVATKFGHAVEALSAGRGLLVEFGDPSDIASKIDLLIKDRQLRQRLSQSAYEYGQSLTWDHIAQKYVHIFSQLQKPEKAQRPFQVSHRWRTAVRE